MTEAYKTLGQLAPTDNAEHVLYTSPSGTSAIVTNITVTSIDGPPASFDINAYSFERQDSDFGVSYSSRVMWIDPVSQNVFVSTDNISWTNPATYTTPGTPGSGWYSLQDSYMNQGGQWHSHAAGPDRVVLYDTYSGAHHSLVSTDLITWTSHLSADYSGDLVEPSSFQYLNSETALVYGTNTFVALNGSYVAQSTDGITWTDTSASGLNSAYYNRLAFGNDVFVATNYNGYMGYPFVATSTDLVNWSEQYLMGLDIGEAGRLFFDDSSETFHILPMYGSGAAKSTDGFTWTGYTLPISGYVYNPGIASGNGTEVFCNGQGATFGFSDRVWTRAVGSTGGAESWTEQLLPFSGFWSNIHFSNGTFTLMDSYFAQLLRSTDGVTWTEVYIPAPMPGASRGVTQNLAINTLSPQLNNIYKNATVSGSRVLEPGITLSANNSITVRGSGVAFSAFGVELS